MNRSYAIAVAITATITVTTLIWLLVPPFGPQAHAQSSDATPLYPQAAFGTANGRAVNRAICQGCHMPDGQGALVGREYPTLAANPKLAAAPYVAMMVLKGRAGMPGLVKMLDDRQVEELVDYVRSHFGSTYFDTLSVEEVCRLRH